LLLSGVVEIRHLTRAWLMYQIDNDLHYGRLFR